MGMISPKELFDIIHRFHEFYKQNSDEKLSLIILMMAGGKKPPLITEHELIIHLSMIRFLIVILMCIVGTAILTFACMMSIGRKKDKQV